MIAPWMIGAFIGLGFGISTWVILGIAIRKRDAEESNLVERTNKTDVLQLVRKFDLVVLPLIGGAVGHFVFGGAQ